MHNVTIDEEQKMTSHAIQHTELWYRRSITSCTASTAKVMGPPSGSKNDTSPLLRLDSSASFHIGPSLWFSLLSALSEIA